MFVRLTERMKSFLLSILLASGLSAAAADVPSPEKKQGPPRGEKGGKGGGGQDVLFAVLDTDGDGNLSVAELKNAAILLRKLDKNGDGNLTQDELVSAKDKKGGKGGKGGKGKGGKPAK
jgi:hypothetical protein